MDRDGCSKGREGWNGRWTLTLNPDRGRRTEATSVDLHPFPSSKTENGRQGVEGCHHLGRRFVEGVKVS